MLHGPVEVIAYKAILLKLDLDHATPRMTEAQVP